MIASTVGFALVHRRPPIDGLGFSVWSISFFLLGGEGRGGGGAEETCQHVG